MIHDPTGRGCLVQAEVLQLKKDLKGEMNAREISNGLPFVEYEIHRQLINKMKVRGSRRDVQGIDKISRKDLKKNIITRSRIQG